LQRCQHGEVSNEWDFREDTGGACGKGIYAMKFGDNPMKKYYSAQGENTYSFDVPDNLVKFLGLCIGVNTGYVRTYCLMAC
jgi:hypothetical protein